MHVPLTARHHLDRPQFSAHQVHEVSGYLRGEGSSGAQSLQVRASVSGQVSPGSHTPLADQDLCENKSLSEQLKFEMCCLMTWTACCLRLHTLSSHHICAGTFFNHRLGKPFYHNQTQGRVQFHSGWIQWHLVRFFLI